MPLPVQAERRRRIFLSYAHRNAAEAQECAKHLRLMRNQLVGYDSDIDVWIDYGDNDPGLPAGSFWRPQILDALQAADLCVVLMSADYAASDFCRNHELATILRRAARGETRVVGVALLECVLADFRVAGEALSLGDVQCVPHGVYLDDYGRPTDALKFKSRYRLEGDARFWSDVREQIERSLRSQPRATLAAAEPKQPIVAADLLPHLCDRVDPCDKLKALLVRYSERGSRRPIVLVTDARSRVDCVDEWIERLGTAEITSLLKYFRQLELAFGEPRPLRWPRGVEGTEQAVARLVSGLGTALGAGSEAASADLHAAHRDAGRPLLLWLECRDADDPRANLHALEAWIGLLGQWPDLELRSTLVVALNLMRGEGSGASEPSQQFAEFDRRLARAHAAGQVVYCGLGCLGDIDDEDIRMWAHDSKVKHRLNLPPGNLRANLPPTPLTMRAFVEAVRGHVMPL